MNWWKQIHLMLWVSGFTATISQPSLCEQAVISNIDRIMSGLRTWLATMQSDKFISSKLLPDVRCTLFFLLDRNYMCPVSVKYQYQLSVSSRTCN